MNDPVLLELFTCLREAGLPLGLAEYHLLLQAVHAGFGTRDRDALAQLCRTLWVKSQREEQIFQDYFDQVIPSQLEPTFYNREIVDTSLVAERKERPVVKRYKTARILRFLLLGLATFVVIGSAGLIKKFLDSQGKENTIAFSSSVFTANTNQKVALIRITRSGDRRGVVRARLNVGNKCLINVSGKASRDSATSLVRATTQDVEFKDGEGEIVIPITLLKQQDNSFLKTVILCLTDPQDGFKLGTSRADLMILNNNYLNLFFYNDILVAIQFISICIQFISICVILLLVVREIRKIRQAQTSENEMNVSEASTNLPKTVLSPEVMRTMADEVQVAQAVRQSDNQLSELFPLIVNDLPVTHRQMKQGWRYLRQFTREGAPTEMDLEATIQQIAQQGTLLNPVMFPPRINRIELLLLIDRDGSMVPFHHLSNGLVDTAVRGGRFSQVRIYYFHNCPDEYLYRDPYHLEAELIDECLLNLPKTRTVCMIFSDAGAARGAFSSKRRRLTKFFLKQLGQHVRYIAWLNPVPRRRWDTTTAKDIAALVPMFEVNRQELYRAIDTLRGRRQPLEEVLR